MLFLLIRYDPKVFEWQIYADDRISQPSSVVDTVVKYHVFRDFTTPIFLMLKESRGISQQSQPEHRPHPVRRRSGGLRAPGNRGGDRADHHNTQVIQNYKLRITNYGFLRAFQFIICNL